jgi:hypothetical protein
VSLAESRRSVAVVFLVALAVWWLEALAMPLAPGRDLGTYLGGYIQLFQSQPIDLGYVLGRTPGATLLIGGLLQFAGGALAEPVVSLLYAGSIVAWFLTARLLSVRAALLTTAVLLVYPGYAILFHELSSDAIFAAAFAGWSLLVVRALLAPSPGRFAWVGAGVGLLSLIRPGNQVLLVLALLPLVLRAPWRARLISTAAFALPAVVLLGGWALHNGLRYDNYTVARGGNATVPFFRTFVTDKIVRPSNGPASRELANVVERDLLGKEPYRSYGITLDDFFSNASPRMEVDLLALSDRHKGWHSNYSWLRDVGVEAVRAHPARYIRGVAGSMSGMLRVPLYRAIDSGAGGTPSTATIDVGGVVLPVPSEGEPIPAAHEGGVTTPDGSIYTVWTSPSEHHLVFVHPGAEQRYDALHRRMTELGSNLPDRRGSPAVVRRLNDVSRWFPPPLLWLALAIVTFAWRRPNRVLALAVPSAAALLLILLTALGLPSESHYSVPVAPAFVFAAFAGFFVKRLETKEAGELMDVAAVRRLAGIGVGVVAAIWAARVYYDTIQAAFSTGDAPHDLAVFLKAAGRVLHGQSPYAYRADETYAYPPLVALLAAPFHGLSGGVATLVWTLLSLAAIAAALWLLGVRDWRCYALTAVYPITRSAVDLGTIGPLLLLAVAVAWRLRDHISAGAAAGAAVALKLYLWPLVVWLVLARRLRSALVALAAGVLFVLLPWAVLGFDGLGSYPGLLRHLADDEASSSFSLVAIGVRLHLPEGIATLLALVMAAALLALAALVARNERRGPLERDVAILTLAFAAALAASPIVWVHYFLLLVVPVALTRPRLSLLWFVPLAYHPLGESAWPGGDAGKLGLALVTTTILILAAVWGSLFAGRFSANGTRIRPSNLVNLRSRARSGEALQR